MARGWESKAVEAQQDSLTDLRRVGPPVNTADAERRGKRATLMLARTRARADLDSARAPAYRSMLEQSIVELDRQLEELGSS